MSRTRADLKSLQDFLLSARNSDGGWGYQPGKGSRLEPTCWALLALGKSADAGVLVRWPAADGLLLERPGGAANYAFHGLALLVFQALGVEHAQGYRTVLAALQRAKGDALPASKINRQNNTLQGWSWTEGTFSWVEPTAWCLLALKQCARRSEAGIDRGRIEIAHRLLVDRCCARGGWNYGNSNMLGQELKPFVPTTAIALLALQDHLSLPEVARSLAFLEESAAEERSATALALALMALRTFGRPAAGLDEALVAQFPTTVALGRTAGAAMALCALSEEEGEGYAAFSL